MARNLGNRLPAELLDRLRGGELYRPGGKATALLTVDAAGWPHVAMVSGIAAVTPETVKVPVHFGSGTLANLERSGKCTVLVAEAGVMLYLKASLMQIERRDSIQAGLGVATLRLEAVLDDTEPGTEILTGVRYHASAEAAAHARAELRAIGADPG